MAIYDSNADLSANATIIDWFNISKVEIANQTKKIGEKLFPRPASLLDNDLQYFDDLPEYKQSYLDGLDDAYLEYYRKTVEPFDRLLLPLPLYRWAGYAKEEELVNTMSQESARAELLQHVRSFLVEAAEMLLATNPEAITNRLISEYTAQHKQ